MTLMSTTSPWAHLPDPHGAGVPTLGMCLEGYIGKKGSRNSCLSGVEHEAGDFLGDTMPEEKKRWCTGLELGVENGVVLVGGGEEARWCHHRTTYRREEGHTSSL
ncbi:hypothetical protein GUJ93_ZPchr0012g20245 [Zizania palustris]|uniref:Uncharacterized protein n=1 Tax=Zizania palustris TaxID=103762 RepID=A0A8J6BVV5_ZIZPA|nr:hypothetical protein GUJ93_ZPchr0012g20245 [Zizania palustris]